MRCNFCGAEWNLPYKMTITECPFCRRPLATPGAGTRSSGYTPQPSGTANKREDFDIVGTVLRAYKGTNPVVYVPEGITELGMINPNTGAFFENKVIQKVVLPKSLKKMSANAFADSSVREVVFSGNFDSIPVQAFLNCANLQIIHLPANLSEIGQRAFENTGLESISVPGSVATIPKNCFKNCSNLRSVELSKGIKVIEEAAFADCTALTEIILPEGTERIYHAAFMNCYYLRRAVIPNSVEHIAQYDHSTWYHTDYGVFCNCTALCDVTWPVNRFNPIIFKDSLYHDKVMADLRAAEAHRKAAAEAAEQKQKQDKKLIDEGICPKCKGKISFWTNRCKRCGTKF